MFESVSAVLCCPAHLLWQCHRGVGSSVQGYTVHFGPAYASSVHAGEASCSFLVQGLALPVGVVGACRVCTCVVYA